MNFEHYCMKLVFVAHQDELRKLYCAQFKCLSLTFECRSSSTFQYWNFLNLKMEKKKCHHVTFLILCAKYYFDTELLSIHVTAMVLASKWDCPTAQLLIFSFFWFSGLIVTLLEPWDCLEFLYTRFIPCPFTLSANNCNLLFL